MVNRRSLWQQVWGRALLLLAFSSCVTQYALAQGEMVITTNYVVVTNIVLVTNFVSQPQPATRNADWVPPQDGFDWVQLKSGEWLKGKIKAMQDRKLEFDSEEVDLQTFDWKDVRRLRSPHVTDVMFEDRNTISGPVEVTPDEVRVGAGEPHIRPRRELFSLTPGGGKERHYWSGKVSVGATFRSGNTEQVDYNAQAHFQRRTPATRLSLDFLGNFSSIGGVESANDHRANTEFDLWLSRRFYLFLPFAQYYRDPFKNLAHQFTVGLGPGYDLIDRPSLEWNITTGPAYQQSWFDSSEPGESTQKGTAAAVFGSSFDWDITSRIELILEYRGIYTSREAGETTHHGVGTLSLELTKRLDLNVSFLWDRISYPKPNADGTVPKPDDFRLVVGLGVDF